MTWRAAAARRLAARVGGVALAVWTVAAAAIADAQIGGPTVNRWTPIGPDGGTVLSLARDPLDDRHLFAGTYFGGLYESTDGGFNWNPLTAQFSGGSIFSLAIDPVRAGTIYAGTFENGLYKSADGGRTWAPSRTGITGVNIAAIAIDPFNSARVIAATTDRGAFLSESAGASWQPVANDTPILAKAVAFDPLHSGVIYVGTLGNGLLRTVDGGQTWQTFTQGLDDPSVLALTFDAISQDRLYAATDGGVFEYKTGASGWTRMSTGLPASEVTQVVSHPSVPGLLFAITPVGLYFTYGPADSYGSWGLAALLSGRLMTIDKSGFVTHLAATHGGLLATTDFGATWIDSSHGMQNVFVGAMAVVANGSGATLYAGTDGVRFTADGVTWNKSNLGLGVFEIKPHPTQRQTLFAGLERDGVWKTTDGGYSWAQTANGILPYQVNAIAQSSTWPHPLYAGTSSGLFISWNSGENWQAVPTGNIPIVLSIAADPVRPITFFGYGAGQVYKTTDEGKSVLPASTGLPPDNIVALKAVAWDKVYAITSGGELYATVDDGLNWLPWRNGVAEKALSVDVNPAQAWIVYLGTAGGGVYKSESGGIDWTPHNQGLTSSFVTALAVDPVSRDTIYAGGVGTVQKSTDGADHWSPTGSGLPAAIVTSLVVDSADPAIVYASFQDQGVYKSVDGGGSWTAINSGLPMAGASPIAIDQFDDTRLYAGTRQGGVFASTDGGATWAARTAGVSLFVRALTIDPTAPDTMYAGSLGGGVFKTTDGAVSWQSVGLRDQNIFKLAVDPQNPSHVFAATAQGVVRSVDAGATWTAGQRSAYIGALAVDPANRQVLYTGANDGQIWRSADSGVTWQSSGQLASDTVRAIAIDGPRRIVYASVGSKGFFRSIDAGLNWTRLADATIDAQLVNAVTVDPVSGAVYAATNEGGVLRSADWGQSWSPVNRGLSSLRAAFVVADPTHSGTVYAATFDSGIFKSIDGAQQWYWVGYGLTTGVVFSVTPDAHDTNVVYAATADGVFKSANGASSWTPIGLSGVAVGAVAVDTADASVLYAATRGAGFYRSAGGGTWTAANTGLTTFDLRLLDVGLSGRVFVGTPGSGVARSTDGGATWQGALVPATAAPPVLAVAVDPRNSGTLYAGTGGVGVLKSVNDGVDWTTVNNGLDSPFVLAIAVDPVAPNVVYAGTVNGVYVTGNGGASWSAMTDGLFNRNVTSLAIDPNDHQVVYAGTEGGGVFVSRIQPPNAGCTFDVTPSSMVLGADGGAQHIQIMAAAGCNWTVASVSDWIIISSPLSGQGSASVDLWVGSNGGADVRTGVLAIAGRQVVISQNAISPWHVLSVTRSGAGHGTVASQPGGIFCADDCTEAFQHGTKVALAAYPDPGSTFVSWSGDPDCSDGSVVVDHAMSCTARFEASNDLDGDTLPDDWERQMGLDPTSATGDDGADGDPDHDGQTNAQEYQAGTHPRGFVTRYFAEGAADGFFDTEFAFLNPSSSDAHVLLHFLTSTGTRINRAILIPARTPLRLAAADVDGLVPSEFATVVESDVPVVAERTLLWDTTHFGSTGETAIEKPSTTWYFADAPAGSGFEHRYLLLNPGSASADVQLSFRGSSAAPIVRSYTVGPARRATIVVPANDPDLANAQTWTTVTASVPIVVERTVYLSTSTQPLVGGHTAAGAAAAAPQWVVPDAPTGEVFDSFAFLANPNTAASNVAATFVLPSGATINRTFSVPPLGRLALDIGQQDPSLANTTTSVVFSTTNDVPIVVEDATWWPGTAATWYEGTASGAIAAPGTKWGVAGAEIGGADLDQTSIVIVNTSTFAGSATVTLLFEDGTSEAQSFALAASGRRAVDLGSSFPDAAWRRFGVIVESTGATPAEIVVERSTYLSTNGRTWDAGSRVVGTRLVP